MACLRCHRQKAKVFGHWPLPLPGRHAEISFGICSILKVPCELLIGYGQVTDAWLAELAWRMGGRVATLDEAFSILHADTATLLPV